jgi:hypothetical protein
MYFFGALAILIGGMSIGANTKEDETSSSGNKVMDNLTIAEGSPLDCVGEMAKWITYVGGDSPGGNAARNAAMEFGAQSPQFNFILQQVGVFQRISFESGRVVAEDTISQNIGDFCLGGISSDGSQGYPSGLGECREGNEVYLC